MSRRRVVRALVRGAGVCTIVAVVLPVIQCVAVRYADPRITWTMVGVARAHGEETGDWTWVAHDSVALDTLPDHVPRYALAAEDPKFFTHDGFDWDAIRAAWEHNREGGSVRGASTISQQVARNAFLWQQRSWLRKGLETWYTVWLELIVPKERILEIYLNIAQTGPMQFGVEAGAQHWYGVPAAKLSKDQASRLIVLLPAPARYTPTGSYAKKRAGWVRAQPVLLPWETKK